MGLWSHWDSTVFSKNSLLIVGSVESYDLILSYNR